MHEILFDKILGSAVFSKLDGVSASFVNYFRQKERLSLIECRPSTPRMHITHVQVFVDDKHVHWRGFEDYLKHLEQARVG